MKKKRFYSKIVSIVMAVCMILGTIPLTGLQVVRAADGTSTIVNPLTTIWKTAEIGTHTETGTYSYDNTAKTVSINGAGTMFDKSAGSDNLFYTYFAAKGDLTIQAKMVVTGTTGQAGLLVRNSEDTGAISAALYADLSKSAVRYGYHLDAKGGGANPVNAAVTPASQDIYVKLEITAGSATYYVGTKADFSDALKRVQGIIGLDAKQIGFFATAGTSATFSDVKVTSVNTADGITSKKMIFDSSIGELIPTFTSSKDYSGTYAADTTFTKSADGNVLNVDNTRILSKGEIRNDKGTDYLLFPATTENYTISAQVNMSRIDNGTDKQGVAVGQFAGTVGSKKAMTMDILQTNKANVTQHNYTVGTSSNGGDPKTASGAVTIKNDYTLSYQKTNNTSIMKTFDASGTILADNTSAPFALANCSETLLEGKIVQYGLAFAGVTAQISNITLTNSEGYVVYDQNDYYIAQGVAPVVSSIDSVEVSALRDAINLTWTATEGKGNIAYVVMVSKDGGEYTTAGTSKVNSFSYKPTADGTYTFKVYGKAGDSSSIDLAQISSQVTYVTPLPQTTLTAVGTDKKVDLSWTTVTGATSYDLYKTDGAGDQVKLNLVKSFGTSELAYSDTDVINEQPYYYIMIAKNDTNTSNATAIQQALPTPGHTGKYVYEDVAAKFNITSKSNDTVTEKKASIAGAVDKTGILTLEVNGNQTIVQAIAANGTFKFDIDLSQVRNDVNLYLTDSSGKVTRKTFNFVYLEKYDILVDGSFKGTDGTLTNGVPTYSTVSAAVATVPADNAKSVVIFIKNGDYNERVVVTSPYVSLLGEDSVNTRIYKSVALSDKTATGMWDRNCMYVDSTADGFKAENLTIENSFEYTNGNDQQADALCIVADQTICINVRLIGYQDTLLTDSRLKDASGNYEVTRQYFQKCYITGNVDFIYGAGTSVFSDCDIVARYTSYKADGCFTAGRTYATTKYGFVFNNCHFLAESGIAAGAFRMARPWGADAETIFINCYLTSAIAATGYGDMSGNSYLNARYAEYGSYGPGFVVNNDRFLFSATQAAEYATSTVLGDYVNELTPANYSAVDKIIAVVKALVQSDYIDFSAVTAAVAAVVFNLDVTQQAKVDGMATNILNAYKALVKKPVAPVLDYTALNAAIAKSDALTWSDFTEETYTPLGLVYKNAVTLSKDLTITDQSVLDNATKALNDGLAALVRRVFYDKDNKETKIFDSNKYLPGTAQLKVKSIVSGTVYENAKQLVKDLSKAAQKELGQVAVFEFNLTDAATNAEITKLNGIVYLQVPVPAGFDTNKKISVFRFETDGSLTRLDTKVVGGTCSFGTDHFSTYVIAEESTITPVSNEPDTTSGDTTAADTTAASGSSTQTGDTTPITMYALIMGISACTIMYITKKKRVRRV